MENKYNSSFHRSHRPEGKLNASSTGLAEVQDVVADGPLCQMCLNYDPLPRLSLLESFSGLATPRSGGWCAYGNIRDIRSRKACLFCKLICRVIPLDLLSTTQIYLRPPPEEIADAYLDIYAERQFQGRIELFNGPIDGYKETVLPNMNPALIRGWLQDCEKDHDHSRLSDCRIYKTPIDITLIDISESRLLRASSRDRYLALSYVWGEVSMFQTTMSNRSSLEEPGSLIKVIEEIPQVIQDSMALVSALGERYLWIDCLCIEQDNKSQKHVQIFQMDIIYSQAVATIVALSAVNAASGLAGVRRNTLLPSYSYETICNLSLRVRAPDFSECIPNAHYESRAWTFQESLLSKRCLLFTNTETYFHCSYGLRRMDDSQVRNNDLLFNTHYTLPDCLLSTPDTRKGKEHWSHAFPGYGQLVREYTHRHLSYSLDALNAFSGFLELFKHRFGGEMISGLPSKFFDAALLWVWVDEQQQHERNFHFPSWSWAGWIGPAQYWAVPDSLLPPFSKNILDRWYFMFEPLRLSRQLKCAIARFYFSRQTPRQEINRDILYIEHSDINAGDILESQTYPSEEPISRDILEFDALAVNIARIRGYKLRNNNQSVTEGVCGAVLSADRNLEDYDQHSTDLVLLSQFSPLSLDQEISKILERIYFDANVLPIRKWCLLNVMIIGWNPGRDCAERLGLCVLHEDIWNRLDSQMKRITLA